MYAHFSFCILSLFYVLGKRPPLTCRARPGASQARSRRWLVGTPVGRGRLTPFFLFCCFAVLLSYVCPKAEMVKKHVMETQDRGKDKRRGGAGKAAKQPGRRIQKEQDQTRILNQCSRFREGPRLLVLAIRVHPLSLDPPPFFRKQK